MIRFADAVKEARRYVLRENTRVFAARWGVSPRSVESWEQGIRAPKEDVQQAIRQLAARTARRRVS